MDSPSQALITKLESLGLASRVEEYATVFKSDINMLATLSLHADCFQELLEYLHTHVEAYTVEFIGSDSIWVPIDYLKVVFGADKNFRNRLNRFVKGLGSNHFRVEEEDVVMELGLGPIGNSFLSFEMTVTLFLNENKISGEDLTKDSRPGKGKGKEEAHLVQEHEDEPADILPVEVEASMALMLLQHDEEAETVDAMLEGEDIISEIPELDISCLHPIVVDGAEFLFLDDIIKSLGLREDEALCILATIAGAEEEDTVQLEFEDHTETKKLEYISYEGQRSLEDTVARALVEIQHAAPEYTCVPETAFMPPKPLIVTADRDDHGSIDIMHPKVHDSDNDTLVNLYPSFNPKYIGFVCFIGVKLLFADGLAN